ncbi:hypothetical protein MP228_008696 [Amoeboaphelidium protococcarum]|nr:hypothetical protein MP228_008696 [Amoeboaphelidium protococcarum]
MFCRNIILVQTIYVWLLCCILMPDAYPVLELALDNGVTHVEMFKRQNNKGGSPQPKKSAAGSTRKPEVAKSRPAAPPKKAADQPTKQVAQPAPKAVPNTARPSADMRAGPSITNPDPKKAVRDSVVGRRPEQQGAQQGVSSDPTRREPKSLTPQQQKQQSTGTGSGNLQGGLPQSDANRGFTNSAPADNNVMRGGATGAPQNGLVEGPAQDALQQQVGSGSRQPAQQGSTSEVTPATEKAPSTVGDTPGLRAQSAPAPGQANAPDSGTRPGIPGGDGMMRLNHNELQSLGFSDNQIQEMNRGTREGEELQSSATIAGIRRYGADRFAAQELGPEVNDRFLSGKQTPEDQQKIDNMKARMFGMNGL